MTSQEDFLGKLINKLNELSIPYMLSGSVSSSLHGHPRATQDVDIVIAPAEEQLMNFVESLGPDYYVSFEAVRDAFAQCSMSLITNMDGKQILLFVRKDLSAFGSLNARVSLK